jgi:hypothetical protein
MAANMRQISVNCTPDLDSDQDRINLTRDLAWAVGRME